MAHLFVSVLTFFSLIGVVRSDVIVDVEIQQDAAIDRVYLRLFDEITPATVTNFLNYVNGTTLNGGSYDGSFVHRSADNIGGDFVIQGGGFTFDPLVGDGTFSYNAVDDAYPGGLQEVTTDPPIVNEFSLSNVRGTIAMAKLSGDPDSATSQWFINLADNSAILDGQNGGFTVFGEVISDGMTVIDGIAAQPVFDRTDIHPAFGELPLINYTADPIEQESFLWRATGFYAGPFWIMVFCNVVVPMSLWFKRTRNSLKALFVISVFVNIGMWYERFVIIVTSLAHEFDPSAWHVYTPSLTELTIMVGSFAWFFFWFLLFAKTLPTISIAEVKEHLAHEHEHGH